MTTTPTWDERADLRFFAFYIGNGTLFLPREPDDDEIDYLDELVDPGPRLGQIFSVYAHTHAAALRGQPRGDVGPSSRAIAWYRQTFRPDAPLAPPIAAYELVPGCGVVANVLALTGDEAHARHRTAQHVRSIVDDDFEPDPELSEDETVLCF